MFPSLHVHLLIILLAVVLVAPESCFEFSDSIFYVCFLLIWIQTNSDSGQHSYAFSLGSMATRKLLFVMDGKPLINRWCGKYVDCACAAGVGKSFSGTDCRNINRRCKPVLSLKRRSVSSSSRLRGRRQTNAGTNGELVNVIDSIRCLLLHIS